MVDAKELRDRLSGAVSETEKRAETFVKLADYHRHAMESRRIVEFRALLAVLALDAYLLAEPEKILGWVRKLGISASSMPSAVLITFVWVVFAVYVGTMLAIEVRNRHDWRRYMTAEVNAWAVLDRGKAEALYGDLLKHTTIPEPGLASWLFERAWAFWSSTLIAALVTCVATLRIWGA